MDLFILTNASIKKVLDTLPVTTRLIPHLVLPKTELDETDEHLLRQVNYCAASSAHIPEICPEGVLPVVIRFPSDLDRSSDPLGEPDPTTIVLSKDYTDSDPGLYEEVLKRLREIQRSMCSRYAEYAKYRTYLDRGYVPFPKDWLQWFPELTTRWSEPNGANIDSSPSLVKVNRQWLVDETALGEFRKRASSLLGTFSRNDSLSDLSLDKNKN